MITVSEADTILHDLTPDFGEEAVSFGEAHGRILRQTILADRALPPYDRVAMDGIAICFASWDAGQRAFPVLGILRAGEPAPPLDRPDACYEVMTGGVLPPGADAVVRVEDVVLTDGVATIADGVALKPRQNIHGQGTDQPAGQALLEPGLRLSSPHLAVIASVGTTTVAVGRRPRVAIISTGDELVEVDQAPLAHQIRRSNAHALAAACSPLAASITLAHLPDQPESIRQQLAALMASHDLLILSGGISMGKFDHIPDALRDLGVALRFTKVAQRPGKPFCFGLTPAGGPVFALPGNPVSSLTCFHRYVHPFIIRAMGGQPTTGRVSLAAPVDFKPSLTYFMPVTLAPGEGKMLATQVTMNGSGDFCGLARSDGFVELPAESMHFTTGTAAPYYPWSP